MENIQEQLVTVVGVRFRTVGKIYYFDPKEFAVGRGSHVIVETARGVEFGTVILGPKQVAESEVTRPLKPLLRVATQADEDRESYNRAREREAFLICRQKIRAHNLDMKLIQAEYTFDNNKLLFYFTADGRIDFRNLVKDLASEFRTRIELRQIGVRDETKILGGVGICGRELCCHTFLTDFAPVSIKMAKEQSLSLNPTKISGTCGRLMCCLNNEAETYEYLNSRLPRQGSYVMTPEGVSGRVQSVSVLRQHVKVMVENGDEREIREYSIDELNEARQRRDSGRSERPEGQDHRGRERDGRESEGAKEQRQTGRQTERAGDKPKTRNKNADSRKQSGGNSGSRNNQRKKNNQGKGGQNGGHGQNRRPSGSQNNRNGNRNNHRRRRPGNQAKKDQFPNE